jgi:hypothetical protein
VSKQKTSAEAPIEKLNWLLKTNQLHQPHAVTYELFNSDLSLITNVLCLQCIQAAGANPGPKGL